METNSYEGENSFNIFSALGIKQKELIHSAFIANLLNPKGNHGCKDLFLKQFLSVLKEKEIIENFETNVYVNTELFLYNTDANADLGKIDIWIKEKENPNYILIENKIFAGDGYQQLKKYSTYFG